MTVTIIHVWVLVALIQIDAVSAYFAIPAVLSRLEDPDLVVSMERHLRRMTATLVGGYTGIALAAWYFQNVTIAGLLSVYLAADIALAHRVRLRSRHQEGVRNK